MKPILTRGIILNRTDYGEADRILTVLTPDHGKLRLMAKGVRKVKSKLAGGIELFSVSDITYLAGRGEIGTLMSTRLISHYAYIINDIERVQLGYDMIKTLDKATEDAPESDYFKLMEDAFIALDDKSIELLLIKAWFQAQLLKLAGHSPNLGTDTSGSKLKESTRYNFDLEAMAFVPHKKGKYHSGHIKVLRLALGNHGPATLSKIEGINRLLADSAKLVQAMLQVHIRV